MIETIDEKDTLKTVSIKKNTWILERPPQLCAHEGMAEGTLVSLTVQDGGIEAIFVKPPSKKIQEISKRIRKANRKSDDEIKYICH